MILGTTYIIVSNLKKSLEFYSTLLNEKPLFKNEDRWVQFSNKIALYNKTYDEKNIAKSSDKKYNKAYIDEFYKDTGVRQNNLIVLNFEVEDLKQEYERLQKANIGKLSELMYVNVHIPYWYFNITDPDGNTLEITGKYE